jgi:hypothetical protein
MKAISIKNPWASLIVQGVKDIENRTWKTSFRGTVLVHASGKPSGTITDLLTQDQFDSLNVNRFAPLWLQFLMAGRYTNSAIIGTVDIVDCVIGHHSIWAEKTDMPAGPTWVEKPTFNWVLKNPVLFPEPILNVKGKLSFWDFDLPTD